MYFFKRISIWVPNVYGCVLISLCLVAMTAIAGRHIHQFLSIEQVTGAKILIVEGWIPPAELDQAMITFRSGKYSMLITTGGPAPESFTEKKNVSYAELARDYLINKGISSNSVKAVPTPNTDRDRTYLSAAITRDWLNSAGLSPKMLDVISSGVHSRRTLLLYRKAFGPEVNVGIRPTVPTEYDPANWWRTSLGTKTVLMESISLIWTVFFFNQKNAEEFVISASHIKP